MLARSGRVLAVLCTFVGTAPAQEPSVGEILANREVQTGSDPATYALSALAALDDGSTLRTGPWRQFLRTAALSARDSVENLPAGIEPSFGLREAALLAFMLAEAQHQSDYKLLMKSARMAQGWLDRKLASTETPSGAALAWAALAIRSARDAAISKLDLAPVVESAHKCAARLDDPQQSDLARLALALAMPDAAPQGSDLLLIASRLEPRDEEEYALALLVLELRAHEPSWDVAMSRAIARRDRIAFAETPTTEQLALRSIAARAAQRHTRIFRLDATLVLRVLDADGKPAAGYVVLPGVLGGTQRLVNGVVAISPAPLPGLQLKYSKTDPRSDTHEPLEFADLGVLPDTLGTHGFEIEFRLNR